MFGILETFLLLGDFVVVYLAFRCKHLMADYFLQTSWMAQGKTASVRWLAPLFSHAAIHGVGTTSITLVFAPSLWWLGLVDVIAHA